MNEVLDDDFYKKEPEPINLSIDKDKDPFVEHCHIQSREVDEVVALLEQQDIPCQIQQKNAFDNTGIVPLTTNQLDTIKMAVFVPKSRIPLVDEIMKKYRAEKEAKIAELGILGVKDFANIILVIIVIVVAFVLIIFNFFLL